MAQFENNAIFWVDLDKIKPNPFQPRFEFDQARLKDLADSIRQYGVLQPLVVTRKEIAHTEGMMVEYELISGERRLRASRLAGLSQVPVIIRSQTEDSRLKLELAIIENLQREDLNPVDRARAFQRLADEFSMKHIQIAEKVGKSREYVSNSLRLLSLPEEILQALMEGKISEGHTRPLMMLSDRKEEQQVLFKEIMFKKLTVREAEAIARRIAVDKVRKKERLFDPELVAMEEKMAESLGTRVHIERKEKGGKIMIDFFSNDDLRIIADMLEVQKKAGQPTVQPQTESVATIPQVAAENLNIEKPIASQEIELAPEHGLTTPAVTDLIAEMESQPTMDDRSHDEIVKAENSDDDTYSLDSFVV